MRWITREKVNVDQAGCILAVRRRIDIETATDGCFGVEQLPSPRIRTGGPFTRSAVFDDAAVLDDEDSETQLRSRKTHSTAAWPHPSSFGGQTMKRLNKLLLGMGTAVFAVVTCLAHLASADGLRSPRVTAEWT